MPEPTPSAAAVATARGIKLAMYLEDPCECDEQSVCWDHLHIARALDAERVKADTLYEAALAFCHSVESTLKHGRASQKLIALERAVGAYARARAAEVRR